jgi:transposase
VVATPGCSGTPGLPVPPGPQRLTELLLEGAAAHGFTGELWTVARITQLIGRQFGADYHPSHVWWLLRHQLGWSPHWQGIERVRRSWWLPYSFLRRAGLSVS